VPSLWGGFDQGQTIREGLLLDFILVAGEKAEMRKSWQFNRGSEGCGGKEKEPEKRR